MGSGRRDTSEPPSGEVDRRLLACGDDRRRRWYRVDGPASGCSGSGVVAIEVSGEDVVATDGILTGVDLL